MLLLKSAQMQIGEPQLTNATRKRRKSGQFFERTLQFLPVCALILLAALQVPSQASTHLKFGSTPILGAMSYGALSVVQSKAVFSAPEPGGGLLRNEVQLTSSNQGTTVPVYADGPVMGTTSAGTTIYPFYWAPNGYNYQSGYRSTMNNFLADVAAGSGSLQNVFGVATQYYQYSKGSFQYIRYDITAGSELDDTNPYPTSGGCQPDVGVGFTVCLTTAQIVTELLHYTHAKGLPAGFANLYTILFPPNVETCFSNSDVSQGGVCSFPGAASGYCGYHSNFNNLIFSVIPSIFYCGPLPSNGTVLPSDGTMAAQDTVSLVSHEALEAMTDPLGTGWSGEVADFCGFENDPPFSPGGWSVQDIYSIAYQFANPASDGCTSSLTTAPLAPTPIITTQTLPSVLKFDSSYNSKLGVVGGEGPFTWSIKSGALPPGLTLSPAGVINGVPATKGRSGQWDIVILVTDSLGQTSLGTRLAIYVPPPPTIVTRELPAAFAGGIKYSETLRASGGKGPYTWALKSGALPPGLAMSKFGVVTGYPKKSGRYIWSVVARDSQGNTSATKKFLEIVFPLSKIP